MKKLLALLLLIVALSVAASGFLGMQAEERYDAVVAQLQAAGYRIVDRTYTRGWFTSSARLQLEVPLPEVHAAGAEPPQVLVKTRAVHGPFLGDRERPLGLARLDTELWLDGAPLVVGAGDAPVRTLVGFLGSAKTLVQVPSRQLSFAGGTLEIAPVAGQFDFEDGAQIARGELSMPSLRLTGQDGAIGGIDGLGLTVDLRRGPGGLPVGGWRLSVGRVSVAAPGAATPVALVGLEIDGRSEVRDDAMDVVADYRLRSLTAEGRTYGPFDLRLAARQLAVDAVARIQAAAEEAAAAGATAEERSEALGVALLANADAFLAKDPSLALERLAFDLPEGRVTATLELRSVGLRVAELRSLDAALQRLQGKAVLRLPEVVLDTLLRQQGRQRLAALAEQDAQAGQLSADEIEEAVAQHAAQQIESLVGQQILVREAGAVAVAAELRNGLLSVNGKSIPLAALVPPPAAPAH